MVSGGYIHLDQSGESERESSEPADRSARRDLMSATGYCVLYRRLPQRPLLQACMDSMPSVSWLHTGRHCRFVHDREESRAQFLGSLELGSDRDPLTGEHLP